MAKTAQFFYVVRPGDTLTKICSEASGTLISGSVPERVTKVVALNPQLKDPNRLMPGDLLRLGTMNPSLEEFFDNDFREMQAIWRRANAGTKDIVMKNFDVLGWMSDVKDGLDYMENVGWQGKHTLEAIPEMSYGVIPGEYRQFNAALSRLRVIRGNTIVNLSRVQISIKRVPVFIVTASTDGFYGYAQKLLRMVEWAEKVNLGKRLLFFEIGVETVKVGKVAIESGDGLQTAKQFGSGFVKVAGGAGAGMAAKRLCGITVKRGPWGLLVCAAGLGVAMYGANQISDKFNELVLGKPIDASLPGLP